MFQSETNLNSAFNLYDFTCILYHSYKFHLKSTRQNLPPQDQDS